jgi:hypothetical protein
MEQHILNLQRSAGNRATAETISAMTSPFVPVQRCGAQVHDGCACADAPAKGSEAGS